MSVSLRKENPKNVSQRNSSLKDFQVGSMDIQETELAPYNETNVILGIHTFMC